MSDNVLSLEDAGFVLLPEKKPFPQRETAQPTQGYSHPRSTNPRDYMPEPNLDPTSMLPNNVQAALISGGRATEGLGRGMQQLFYRMTGNQDQLDRLKASEAEARQTMAPINTHYPVSSSFGASLPQMAVPGGGGVASLSGLAKTFLQGAAVPALSYGSAGERAGGAVLGGLGNVAGSAIGQAVGKALRPAEGRVTPETADFAKYMKDAYGITTLPGSLMGNDRLRRFEAQLPSQLGSSNAASDLMQANQRGFNKAAASAIGENADNVGDVVRNAAQDRVSQGYQDLASRASKTVDLNDPVKRAALDAYKTVAEGRLKKPPQDVVDALNTIIETSWQKGATESQKTLGKWVTDIGEMQRDALKGGSKTLAEELGKVKAALNDARYAKSPAGDRELRAALDKNQATLYTLDAMRKNGVVDDMGNIKIGSVDATLRKNVGRRTGAIQDPLSDLAEYNARFPKINDSGTAANIASTKQSMLNPANWPGAAMRAAYLSQPVQNYMQYGVNAVLPKIVRDPLEELLAAQYAGMPLGLRQIPISAGGLLGTGLLSSAAGSR